MGKPLRRQDSDVGVEENHPGCIWGIFHILDYHHWHTVKKILPHKWHRGRRHARCKHLNFPQPHIWFCSTFSTNMDISVKAMWNLAYIAVLKTTFMIFGFGKCEVDGVFKHFSMAVFDRNSSLILLLKCLFFFFLL